jgi:hypothetical protein
MLMSYLTLEQDEDDDDGSYFPSRLKILTTLK